MAAATEQFQHNGGGGTFDREIGCVTFPGTNISVDVNSDLSELYFAHFIPVGTAAPTKGITSIQVGEAEVGTATGVVAITGSAITLLRTVELGGTVEEQKFLYEFVGKS